MKVVSGIFAPCPTCQAPWVQPLPAGWTITAKRYWQRSHYVTTHVEDCPDGFRKVVVPDAS